MLSSVLHRDRAIQVNIQIVRIFTEMREMLTPYKKLVHKLEKIEQKLTSHENQILTIFEYLKHLMQNKLQELNQKIRKRISYKRKNET
jgi:hypothetical protein